MREFALSWYGVLNSVFAALSGPLAALTSNLSGSLLNGGLAWIPDTLLYWFL